MRWSRRLWPQTCEHSTNPNGSKVRWLIYSSRRSSIPDSVQVSFKLNQRLLLWLPSSNQPSTPSHISQPDDLALARNLKLTILRTRYFFPCWRTSYLMLVPVARSVTRMAAGQFFSRAFPRWSGLRGRDMRLLDCYLVQGNRPLRAV